MNQAQFDCLLRRASDRHLRLVVREAVGKFGGFPEGVFNTANFAAVLKDEYGLPSAPDGRVCALILRGLPFVRPLPGGCHWRLTNPSAVLISQEPV